MHCREDLCRDKTGGFDALKPKPRKDIGRARAIDEGVADLLVSIKDEHRAWSVAMVIDSAKNQSDAARATTLPLSTVHRILSRAGVMDKRPEDPTSNDRLHFAYERASELWMSDVMHGPAVYIAGRRKQKTYLICLVDDARRVVPYAAFAFSESTSAFLPVLKQGIVRRGIPLRLYVDNGSAFRSHHLALVCARLGITLIHARPYKPQTPRKADAELEEELARAPRGRALARWGARLPSAALAGYIRTDIMTLKPLRFLGDSLKRLREFPKDAKHDAGYQLDQVQRGRQPADFKPMPSIGKGVEEIRVWDDSGAYRVMYTARLTEAVVVLHAVQKKTQATPKQDIEIAKERFEQLMRERR